MASSKSHLMLVTFILLIKKGLMFTKKSIPFINEQLHLSGVLLLLKSLFLLL